MLDRATLALMVLAIGCGGLPTPAIAQPVEASDAAEPASQAVIQFATWVKASRDNRDLPFIVIDKTAAAIFLFDIDGHFIGTTPALLGSAHGDGTVIGIGDRELSAISPDQRTTPAGRFLATFGAAKRLGKVLWVDYASSLALHPVVTGNKKERRLQRLRSPSSTDNRITYGCINISASFFEDVVRTLFRNASGVVYILPETKSVSDVFPTVSMQGQPSLPANLGG